MFGQVSLTPKKDSTAAILWFFMNMADRRNIHAIIPHAHRNTRYISDPYIEIIITTDIELLEYLSREFEIVSEL